MKRLIHLLLAFCIVLSLCGPVSVRANSVQSAPDSTVYTKKHVSILYDNSGSMRSNKSLKWCYASYAAQVFTGLLNDTDTLSVTFMEGKPLQNLDLAGPRQEAVSKVLENTKSANADTPIAQISAALSVLEGEGLKPGLGNNPAGEQFWLVLTTDGIFRENGEDLSAKRVVDEIEAVMKRYPDLHVVYFGIGTENGNEKDKAVDFRQGSVVDPTLLDRLHSHPYFSAEYAENQDQIVETMQGLSNQISGRYSVSDAFDVSGDQVRLHLSGESSPIRNIAVMAQKTNARLVSVTAEDGTELKVDREAEIRFPHNDGYANVDEKTLGGYTALITGQNGSKIPNGEITLKFSEPVSADRLSLMYEPAIHIRLQVERKADSGQWEAVPYNANLVEGDEIRASYAVCEDGTDKELDIGKLFGKSEATTLFNGKQIRDGETMTVSQGDSVLDVNVSMMDGGYQISTSRTLHVSLPGAGDFTIKSTGPIELRRSAAAENTDEAVEFSVLFRGEPADKAYTAKVKMQITGDAGAIKGKEEKPQSHVFRFTPKDDGCKAGDYTVHLLYDGTEIASEQIRILPNEDTFTAEAGPSISIMSNRVGDNDEAVTFTVTAHRDEIDEPITAAEANLFTVKAEGSDGAVSGAQNWQSGGVISFTLRDSHATAGNYDVSLWKDDEKLAQNHITVIHYDATFTVETVVSDPDKVDRYDLLNNQSSVSFIVYEDGTPCPAGQLESMLGREITVTHDLESRFAEMDVKVDVANGKPAIVCTPASSTKSKLLIFFRRILITLGVTGLNRSEIHVGLKVDMPHGDEGAGTLKLFGYRGFYLVILLVFLALLALAGMFLFANMKAQRLNKGAIWMFTMRNDKNVGGLRANKAGAKMTTGWGWKPMLLVPVDETHSLGKVRFLAKANPAAVGFKKKSTTLGFQRQHPMVEIKGTPAEIENYHHSDVSPLAAGLLREIFKGKPVTLMDGGSPLDAETFFTFIGPFTTGGDAGAGDSTSSKSGKKRKKKKEKQTQTQILPGASRRATYHISNNSAMIYQESGSGENTSYTVWVYEAKKKEDKKSNKKMGFGSKKKSAGKKGKTGSVKKTRGKKR